MYPICIFFIYLVLVSEPKPLQLAIPVGAGNGTNFAVGIAQCAGTWKYRYVPGTEIETSQMLYRWICVSC